MRMDNIIKRLVIFVEHSTSFQCMRCLNCCTPEHFGAEISYVPIYLDEVDRIRDLAAERNLEIKLEPDLMYYDELNNRLIIVTYTLQLGKEGCPFHDEGCSIHKYRPITCKSYPLLVHRLGNTTGIMIKPECAFVQQNSAKLEDLDYYDVSDVFSDEFRFAREIQIKGNAITDQIEQLEADGKIKVPVKVPVKITEETKTMDKIRLDAIT